MLASEMFTFQKFWAQSHALSQYADLSDMSECMAIQPNVFWFTSIYTVFLCLMPMPMHDSYSFSFSFAANFVCVFIAVHCLFIVIRKWDSRDGDFEGKNVTAKNQIYCVCAICIVSFFDSWFLVRAFIYTLTTWKKTQFIHFNSCPVCLLACGVSILLVCCYFRALFFFLLGFNS